MDFSDKLVLIIAAVSLGVLILGLMLIPAQPVITEDNITENTSLTETPEPPKTDVWSLLSSKNVEEQCLKQARAYAAQQGIPSFAVSSCRCSANETADIKSYDCTISAIDGTHKVDANCVKKDERCIFTSMGGAIVYTFDELEKMIIE